MYSLWKNNVHNFRLDIETPSIIFIFALKEKETGLPEHVVEFNRNQRPEVATGTVRDAVNQFAPILTDR